MVLGRWLTKAELAIFRNVPAYTVETANDAGASHRISGCMQVFRPAFVANGGLVDTQPSCLNFHRFVDSAERGTTADNGGTSCETGFLDLDVSRLRTKAAADTRGLDIDSTATYP